MMKKGLCLALVLFFVIGLAGTSFANNVSVVGTVGPAIATGTVDGIVPVIPPVPPPKK